MHQILIIKILSIISLKITKGTSPTDVTLIDSLVKDIITDPCRDLVVAATGLNYSEHREKLFENVPKGKFSPAGLICKAKKVKNKRKFWRKKQG